MRRALLLLCMLFVLAGCSDNDCIRECSITDTVADLEVVIPNINFIGEMCEFPAVFADEVPLLILSIDDVSVLVDVTGLSTTETIEFLIDCPCIPCTVTDALCELTDPPSCGFLPSTPIGSTEVPAEPDGEEDEGEDA